MKKHMGKWISFSLAVTMTLTAVPVTALADGEGDLNAVISAGTAGGVGTEGNSPVLSSGFGSESEGEGISEGEDILEGEGTLKSAGTPAGEGTEASPYQITSEEDLIWFSKLVDGELNDGTPQNTEAWAELAKDIVLTEPWNTIADEYSFEGNFDGKDYTISGLDIEINCDSDDVYAGLFGCNEGTIKNVNVEGSITVTGEGEYDYTTAKFVYAAGISGANYGTIESCNSAVAIEVGGNFDASIGGIAGYNKRNIISCNNQGNITVAVSCYAMAGGISGRNHETVESCSNSGEIDVTVDGTGYGDYAIAGGICGVNYKTVASCSNSGDVTGTVTSAGTPDYAFVGGICGWNQSNGKTVYCSNSGPVTGNITPAENNPDYAYVGGICGRNEHNGEISRCDNSGKVTSPNNYANIGGICGGNFRNKQDETEEGKIMYCVNSGVIEGPGTGCNIGGICGINYASIDSCSNFSTVTGRGKVGAVCGWQYVGTGVIKSYFCSEKTSKGIGDHEYGAVAATGKTSDAYASGEVAWSLGSAWEQKLGADTFPTPIMTTAGTYEVVRITVKFPEGTDDAICYANKGQPLSNYPNSNPYVFYEDAFHTTWIDPETKTYEDNTTIYALEVEANVEQIVLDQKDISLYVDETANLTATVTPVGATCSVVKWSSSNENVATVDQDGKVTAIAKGTATITAAAVDGSGVSAECDVTVKRKVESIVLDQNNISLYVNRSIKLTATVTPADATGSVVWRSSNENVATVDQDGNVTAIAKGTAIITAAAVDGSGVSATCDVTVKRKSSSSSSSGGGSSVSSSDITVENSKHGEVTVNKDSAAKGDKVTITVKPDDGYVLDKLTVKDENGDKIKVEEGTNGKYTFTMPEGDVSITAEFVKEATEEVTEETTLNFVDVSSSDWFYPGVKYVVEHKIMSGISDVQFGPGVELTRGMMVQMLYNLEGRPAAEGANAFTDVAAGQWYTDAVVWATGEKIVSGMGDNLFAPNEKITREQMVVMLYNYAKYLGMDTAAAADMTQFTDGAKVSAWALDAVRWAVAEGYLSGMGNGTLAPQGTATRAEIASVFMRFMKAM